jgi:hypothetical protein
MTERLANSASSVLTAAITSTATTLTVASASSFPSSGNFRIVCDTEIMIVTGVSSNTFTITRGSESTTAAAHAFNAQVAQILTSGGISQYISDRSLTGTLVNLPSAGTSGRLYYPTNAHFNYYDNGTSWFPYGPTWPLTPPVDSNFSWVNQGSSTISTTNGTIVLDSPSNGATDSMRARVATLPGVSYTIVMGFYFFGRADSGATAPAFLLLREASTGKMTSISIGAVGGPGQIRTWNNADVNTFTGRSTFSIAFQSPIWLKLQDNGTNIIYSAGCSPYDFIQLDSQTRTTPFSTSATQYGFALDPFGFEAKMSVFHLTATSP